MNIFPENNDPENAACPTRDLPNIFRRKIKQIGMNKTTKYHFRKQISANPCIPITRFIRNS